MKNRLRAWELAMLALTAALILALLLYPAPEPGVYAERGSAVVGLEAAAAGGRLNVNTATAAELELLPGIERVADKVLAKNGFNYTSHAEWRKEEFPTRVYDGVTLEAGVYDALIVELGTGKGDNWWCVVYPPLCFSGAAGSNVQYRSRILEIIRNFFGD